MCDWQQFYPAYPVYICKHIVQPSKMSSCNMTQTKEKAACKVTGGSQGFLFISSDYLYYQNTKNSCTCQSCQAFVYIVDKSMKWKVTFTNSTVGSNFWPIIAVRIVTRSQTLVCNATSRIRWQVARSIYMTPEWVLDSIFSFLIN